MVTTSQPVNYPDSDGQPMADNTKQFEAIVYLKKGFDLLFTNAPNVFVAGDLLWYPVQGNNKLRQAPDVMIVFGRPKGDRGSYQQWKEDNICPQVVFEVISPGNTIPEMSRKFQFYDRYGVEEYYIYDPDRQSLDGFIRRNGSLETIEEIEEWVSPRLMVCFRLSRNGQLILYRLDGQAFETYEQMAERVQQEQARAEREQARAEAAEQEIERLKAQIKALEQQSKD
ncbi:Uma2 family endonuclease [Chroococcus sp. FPU101]|uniref:Uma2 family endonuclease n=1 Tax=Chroococcus sp. FPU101 TaxID=1974212 RepID=UPI001A8C6693|nr:Uma2 family endonuclease [Chroococcus sp. FPU101]GFE70832.1 hypothetical protein CFPU101_34420 [Chroococcus sp. FPU101]